ncbi:unnamed protein product [Hymenolepis diminuta]|uniref:Secreted protein n=1 Tax=Hymenolepis diminuta TaxID=6216 RepID=A0A0R3SZI5_HYMDI|nr:unnamed protein product [Hymenolepis diminuta]
MQSTVGIFSILLLALTLSNFWQTEAIVMPVDKLEQNLFSEDVVGDADSKSESVGLQDVEHNGDIPILTVKVLTQCLLSPILTHRAESRTGPGPGSGSGSASPTSTP